MKNKGASKGIKGKQIGKGKSTRTRGGKGSGKKEKKNRVSPCRSLSLPITLPFVLKYLKLRKSEC